MPHSFTSFREALHEVPLTLALIALSVLGFLLIYLGAPLSWMAALTYTSFEFVDNQLVFVAADDVADYERIHRTHLAGLPHVAQLRSSFALRAVCDRKAHDLG